MEVSFSVPGKPQGKARARTVKNRKTGNSFSYTPEQTILYENQIKSMYIGQAKGYLFERGTPVAIRMTARFLPPASTSKKKQRQMLEGEILPQKKPDIDNIVKTVLDALNGVAYQDDTQVIQVSAVKVYSAVECVDVTIEECMEGTQAEKGGITRM